MSNPPGKPTTDISIRFATLDDAEDIYAAVIGIAETVGERHKVKSTAAMLRRDGFGDAAKFETLIAEVGGRFAGCCLYFPSYSTWNGQPGVYIQDFYVADAFRGQGVGEALLRRLAAITRKRGGAYIRLAVDSQNHRAQAFYTRSGIGLDESDRIHAAYDDDFTSLADADGQEDR